MVQVSIWTHPKQCSTNSIFIQQFMTRRDSPPRKNLALTILTEDRGTELNLYELQFLLAFVVAAQASRYRKSLLCLVHSFAVLSAGESTTSFTQIG